MADGNIVSFPHGLHRVDHIAALITTKVTPN